MRHCTYAVFAIHASNYRERFTKKSNLRRKHDFAAAIMGICPPCGQIGNPPPCPSRIRRLPADDFLAAGKSQDSKRPPGEEIRWASLSMTDSWEEECHQSNRRSAGRRSAQSPNMFHSAEWAFSSGIPGSGSPHPLHIEPKEPVFR